MTTDELITRLRNFRSDSPYETELVAAAAARLGELSAKLSKRAR